MPLSSPQLLTTIESTQIRKNTPLIYRGKITSQNTKRREVTPQEADKKLTFNKEEDLLFSGDFEIKIKDKPLAPSIHHEGTLYL